MRFPDTATVAQIDFFDEVIDVRSPAEFAEDHLPGAASFPVLDDAERAEVGTVHKQVSPFAAKIRGASLISRRIAQHVEESFASRPKDWRPLIYCWRGGKRSGALAHVLNEIGWKAVQLDGGYRAYRRHVRERLAVEPARLRYRVICGLTGSGKSRLLRALAAVGAQVLDLERLARHRGSLLGDLPDEPQPSQKRFDCEILDTLARFDPARPVYVESESRRIGALEVPDVLLTAVRAAPCIRLETPQRLRVELLLDEYPHFLADVPALCARLARLTALHGRRTIERWAAAAAAGDWDALVAELLTAHYDPTYARAIERNFAQYAGAILATPSGIGEAEFHTLALALDAETCRRFSDPAGHR